jgi:hypothetical protein
MSLGQVLWERCSLGSGSEQSGACALRLLAWRSTPLSLGRRTAKSICLLAWRRLPGDFGWCGTGMKPFRAFPPGFVARCWGGLIRCLPWQWCCPHLWSWSRIALTQWSSMGSNGGQFGPSHYLVTLPGPRVRVGVTWVRYNAELTNDEMENLWMQTCQASESVSSRVPLSVAHSPADCTREELWL